jgi:hypothetical protein
MPRARSFWPADLKPSADPTPEEILRRQAEDLKQQTGGVLHGAVEPGSQGDWVTISFLIVAPRLDDYAYRLFKVRHKVPDPFSPLEIIVDSKDIRRVTSQQQFERELERILGSNATRSVLTQLLSLSENTRAAG